MQTANPSARAVPAERADPELEPAPGPPGSERVRDRHRPLAPRVGQLRAELVHRGHVAEAAERARAALGDDVGTPSGRAQLGGDLLHDLRAAAVLVVRDPAELRSGEPVEERIGLERRRP